MTESDDIADIPEVTPPQAMEILKLDKSAVLIDVRSKVEFDYVGHPSNAISVPWQEAPEWTVNPDFVDKVKIQLEKENMGAAAEDLKILMLCRSGGRSMDAAIMLSKRGFSNVLNISEGFEGTIDEDRHRGNINGWRFHNLPWEQT